jgi:Dirigent-like protein
MSRRIAAAPVGGLVLGLLLGVSGMAIGQSQMPGGDLTVVERATTDAVVDIGETGDTIGDLLAFGNDLYDAANTVVVGRDEGACVRTNPGLAWECTWTNILADGSITVQGPFPDSLEDSELAITGGTGAYASASGTMTLHARDEAGSEFDFTFHLAS